MKQIIVFKEPLYYNKRNAGNKCRRGICFLLSFLFPSPLRCCLRVVAERCGYFFL